MEMCDEPTCDVYVYEWERDSLTRLTRDRAHDGEPVWTPDGRRLAFYSERGDGTDRQPVLAARRSADRGATAHRKHTRATAGIVASKRQDSWCSKSVLRRTTAT